MHYIHADVCLNYVDDYIKNSHLSSNCKDIIRSLADKSGEKNFGSSK